MEGRPCRRLGVHFRAQLLRVLTSPPDVRADAIRQFYERPERRGLAEVLMDLEADDLLRAEVMEVLRAVEP